MISGALELEFKSHIRDPACPSAFTVEIMNHFDALQLLDSAIDWDTFKDETVGTYRLRDGNSVSVETLVIVDDRRAARLSGDRRWHRELVKTCKVQLQINREGFNSPWSRSDLNVGTTFCKP